MTQPNGGFEVIRAEEIAKCFETETRQYLVGILSRPQLLTAVRDAGVEIGVTRYREDSIERPHWHPLQREYQLMLDGSTEYREVSTGRFHRYRAGDFYAILPGTCYHQRSAAGTRILFVKVPSVADKITCRLCSRVECQERLEPFTG